MDCLKYLPCLTEGVCPNQLFNLPVLLDPADEKLLEEDIQAPSSSKRYDYPLVSLCCIHMPLGFKHLLVLKVTAACQGGPMDEKDRVYLNRV